METKRKMFTGDAALVFILSGLAACALAIVSPQPCQADQAAKAEAAGKYGAEAREVMACFQKTFWDPQRQVYVRAPDDRKPDYVWRQAAAFSALVAAARHEPRQYRPILDTFFHGLEAYWDSKAPIPAYEPAPTHGNGNDKYYDDNEWILISLMEGYELTHEKAYLTRALQTARFIASGWDQKLGGGIWWHQLHKDDSKNACSNGPAAVGYLLLARLGPADQADAWASAAEKAVKWTDEKLQADDGLFDDRIIVTTGEVKKGKLTYNSALMLRANLALYRRTGQAEYLEHARRIGEAADQFTDKKTGVYRDALKWSQFMVEADIDLYRTTGEAYLLRRAQTNADAYYAAWKKEPSKEMMSNAGTARILWLMADLERENRG